MKLAFKLIKELFLSFELVIKLREVIKYQIIH